MYNFSQPSTLSYPRRHPFFKRVPTLVSIHAVASAARAASFLRANRKLCLARSRLVGSFTRSVPTNALMVTHGTTSRLSAEAHSSHTAWGANGEFAGRFEERLVIGRQSFAGEQDQTDAHRGLIQVLVVQAKRTTSA
jgi:hypothetical protein